jgi:hypothetical protein
LETKLKISGNNLDNYAVDKSETHKKSKNETNQDYNLDDIELKNHNQMIEKLKG